jgi:diacylglycerol O-acyltransferase
MPYTHCERLSATDALFLELENESVHMHVGAVALFDSGPLRGPEGRLDVDRLRDFVEAALFDSPRCRQRVVRIPGFDHPVWVDDERFNLLYHLRHTALPAPGSLRQLKRLSGRIMSQKLDRGKPLWELWIVEGLEDGRIALIFKAHHCMVDGIAGIDLIAVLLRLEPDAPLPEPRRWVPRAAPSSRQMVAAELGRRASLPLDLLRGAPASLRRPRELMGSLRESAAALGETVGAGLAPTSPTPLNPDIGPYRRFDWTQTDRAAVEEVRKHLGGTLNDVVLASVAGAVGRFLRRRGVRVDARTVFRSMVPVSIRRHDEHGAPGNRVVNFLARLPVDERDPRRRLERTAEVTRALKHSRLVRGAEILEEMSDRTFPGLVLQFVKLAADQRAYNLVVTNIPGPPRPLYLLGARMDEIYPVVPLFSNQALGIALFSYDGRLCWGFNADWDALPDLHDLVDDVSAELEALRQAAERAGRGEAGRPEAPA